MYRSILKQTNTLRVSFYLRFIQRFNVNSTKKNHKILMYIYITFQFNFNLKEIEAISHV